MVGRQKWGEQGPIGRGTRTLAVQTILARGFARSDNIAKTWVRIQRNRGGHGPAGATSSSPAAHSNSHQLHPDSSRRQNGGKFRFSRCCKYINKLISCPLQDCEIGAWPLRQTLRP